MIVIDSDGHEENCVLISSSQCIIFNKISALKNTVFLVKLLPCRCRSQPYDLKAPDSPICRLKVDFEMLLTPAFTMASLAV